MRVLVAGWFSFESGHATAGDVLARDLACAWLEEINWRYDVAVAAPFTGGVDWRTVRPEDYSHVVFVCGPFEEGELEAEFLSRFGRCRLIGLNLSMQVPLEAWNPFDFLLERDSTEAARPDIAFLTEQPHVPVVGVCLVESYPGAMDQQANVAIQRLVESTEMAVVSIDTRLDMNSAGLRTPGEIESLIARMDVVVTTRLHGTVLALKNRVPVIAIDPMSGGAKIRRQAETIGWPVVFNVDELTDDLLRQAFEYCLTSDARRMAKECSARAKTLLEEVHTAFLAGLLHPQELENRYCARQSRIFSEGENTSWYHDHPASRGRGAGRGVRTTVRGLRQYFIERVSKRFLSLRIVEAKDQEGQ